ncbi:MAG: OmpH family outer membrane protein [Chitinophagaceae bacterium]|jgi:outer membrane protein
MNQKVVNVILAAGIAILLFLQLRPVNQAPVAASPVSGTAVKLGYVDLDSVQERYLLYKEKMDMFDKKKEDADRNLNSAFQKIENERIAFAKRGESITQVEFENFQRAYQTKMQNLEEQKRVLENQIAEEGESTLTELRSTINDFLKEYNKTKGYTYIFSYSSSLNMLFYKDSATNITDEVVEGLNAAYNKSKKGK